jgi:hypothetical protein
MRSPSKLAATSAAAAPVLAPNNQRQTTDVWLPNDPVHCRNQATTEELYIEDVPPVVLFFGQQKVE